MAIEQTRFSLGSINLSAIFVGAIIALVVNMALMLLGSAIGLAAIPFERAGSDIGTMGMIGGGIYAIVTAVVSFFVGGYVASRSASIRHKWDAALHGVASFCLATLVVSFFMGSTIASSMSTMLGQATGISAGATGGEQVLRNMQDKAQQAANSALSPEARGTVEGVRKGAATASLASFVLLLIGAASGGWGGLSGARASLRVPRTIDLHETTDRAA